MGFLLPTVALHHEEADCGKNFIVADAEIMKLYTQCNQEHQRISKFIIDSGTHWSSNPPAAPHMGSKSESVVKSIKYHLNRAVRDLTLTFEELTTLLAQIEAILNSSPLEPLSDDPDDLAALTPGHFLVGTALTTVLEPSLTDLSTSRLSRWQLIQQRTQQFWSRWSTSYLQHHHTITKWFHKNHEIKIGSLVLLTDERFPPTKWPLARIINLHPGLDGLPRVATIKTATMTLSRPITKLVILPIATQDETSTFMTSPLQHSRSRTIINPVADGARNDQN